MTATQRLGSGRTAEFADVASGGGGSAAFLAYAEDDSSGATGFGIITSPKLGPFSIATISDILVVFNGHTTFNAVFTYVQVKIKVSWTGGGGGFSEKVIKTIQLGAVTATTMPLTGSRKFSAIPAGDVTVEINVVSLGVGDLTRSTDQPMTLEAWKIG